MLKPNLKWSLYCTPNTLELKRIVFVVMELLISKPGPWPPFNFENCVEKLYFSG
jgi:hypothetical protein